MEQCLCQLSFLVKEQKRNLNTFLLSFTSSLFLLFIFAASAHSTTLIPFTGNYAYGVSSSFWYYPSANFAPYISGDNNAHDAFGTAAQFTIDNKTYISDIDFTVEITNYLIPTTQANTIFNFIIYQGNGSVHGEPALVPNHNYAYQSDNIFIQTDMETSNGGPGGVPTYYDTETFSLTSAVGITLNPGVFWLAAEGGNTSTGTGFTSVALMGTPVPEPSTIFLLGAGLAGAGIFRRKHRKS